MSTASTLDRRTLRALRSERLRRARRYLMLYGFCVIPVAALLVFHYIPIYGILLAFKDFKYNLGILGSPWNDFQHFRDLFTDPFFPRIVRNSIIISVLKIIFAFPAPILLAILINEIRTSSLKRTIQSISYLPHFMSWVVLAGIIEELLSPQRGLPLFFATLFGADRVPDLLADPQFFRAMLVDHPHLAGDRLGQHHLLRGDLQRSIRSCTRWPPWTAPAACASPGTSRCRRWCR